MSTITNSKKQLSTKYQVFLEMSGSNSFPLVSVVITDVTAATTLFSFQVNPLTTIGLFTTYRVDIGPILEDAIGYIPFSSDVGMPSHYDNTIRIATSDSGGGSDTWDTKFNKIRKDFYQYWQDVTDNNVGAVFPASGIYPNTLTCYRDAYYASALQLYSYVATEIVEVIWRFNNGDPNSNEDIEIATAGNGFIANMNVGLDELVAASVIVSDPNIVASYNIKVDGGTIDHEVNVVDLSGCKYKPLSLTYINSHGLWESISLPAVFKEKIISRKESYRREASSIPLGIGALGTRDATFPASTEVITPIFDYDYVREYNVVTDWIGEYEMEQFRFAASSDIVYMKIEIVVDSAGFKSGFFVPVNILENEVLIRERGRDKIFNIDMDVQLQPLNK